MTAADPQKFTFDVEFDPGGEAIMTAPRPRRLVPSDEVETIRQAALAEGERTALTGVAARQADALAAIAQACGEALPRLAQVAHEHRIGAARLSLACARAIADAALARFPEEPVRAAVEALAREVEAQPRLTVTAEPELAAGLQSVLEEAARGIGFEGAIQVKSDAGLGRHAFTLDFGDGAASFDPEAAAQRVTRTLEAALAAEGLHAEPLTPGSEG